MENEILFVLLDEFADWEGAYIASSLHAGVEPGRGSRYTVKTVPIRQTYNDAWDSQIRKPVRVKRIVNQELSSLSWFACSFSVR